MKTRHIILTAFAAMIFASCNESSFLDNPPQGTVSEELLMTPEGSDQLCTAAKCPKLVSPAMNTNMYENRIVQDNIKKLEHYGFEMIKPAEGYLACGDIGAGKMPGSCSVGE